MKLAYLISAYQDPKHLARLIKALDPNADFYVHIDAKSPEKPFHEPLQDFPKVTFTPKRFAVNWGSFAQVSYQQELLGTALRAGKNYDRLICLSGQDYPLWSNQKISHTFLSQPDVEFIKGYNISKTSHQDQLDRIVVHHFLRDIKTPHPAIKRALSGPSRILMKKLPFRKPRTVTLNGKPADIYMGSDYWALSHECASYVHTKMQTEARLMNYFRHSFVPSEMVVQTLVFNSEFNTKGFICPEEDYQNLAGLTPLHHIQYDKQIKVFTAEDFSELMNTGKMFFRKAVTGISDQLLDRIDSQRQQENR